MWTPPAGSRGLVASKGGRLARLPEIPDAPARDSRNPVLPGAELELAANTTCCRRYGPPDWVRVVSALAILAATTSARTRSACMALPDVSINPKRFIPCAPALSLIPALLIRVDRIHHHLVLLPQHRHAGLEFQLCLGQVQALPVHRNIVTIRARNQALLEFQMHRRAASFHVGNRGAHLCLEVEPAGLVSGRIHVGHVF